MAALCGTTPGVPTGGGSSNFSFFAISWMSGFFSCSSSISGSTAGAPMRTSARRHSWKMPAPRPVMNRPLMQRRDRLRVAELGQPQRRLLVQQEVLLVGRRGQDLHQRRHGALVADLHQRADRGDARVVGARLDRQRLLRRLDQRVDRVGRLHVAEHAGGDGGAVEVVVAVVERLDEQRLRCARPCSGPAPPGARGAWCPGRARSAPARRAAPSRRPCWPGGPAPLSACAGS